MSREKVALQLVGGVGGANVKFYQAALAGQLTIPSYYSNYAYSSVNHFQLHGGVGIQIYPGQSNLFIRPQFDIRYVPNFIEFGRNVVTSETVWIGYSFGERQ